MALSASDLTVVEGDARIADTHLQAVLGYSRMTDLHAIIVRHEDELADYGGVLRQTSAKPPAGSKGGRPGVTYYLTEPQATLVCMFARTPKARAARKLIVDVFTAWRTGQLARLPIPVEDPFAALQARLARVEALLGGLPIEQTPMARLTQLPIWANGRRPWWWSNLPLRTFLTETHRQMKMQDCVAEAKRRFGQAPSMSGLNRYWMQLDRVLGPGRAA